MTPKACITNSMKYWRFNPSFNLFFSYLSSTYKSIYPSGAARHPLNLFFPYQRIEDIRREEKDTFIRLFTWQLTDFCDKILSGLEKNKYRRKILVGRFTVPFANVQKQIWLNSHWYEFCPSRVSGESRSILRHCTAITSPLHVVLCGINQRRCGII